MFKLFLNKFLKNYLGFPENFEILKKQKYHKRNDTENRGKKGIHGHGPMKMLPVSADQVGTHHLLSCSTRAILATGRSTRIKKITSAQAYS
jgi:hypothetical protein